MMLLNKKSVLKTIIEFLLMALLCSLLLLIMEIPKVSAGANMNGDKFVGGSLGSCGGSNCLWQGHVGIRFSLVTKEGGQVTGTHHVDVVYKSQVPDYLEKNYNLYDNNSKLVGDYDCAYYGKNIKQDVFSGGSALTCGDFFGQALDIAEVLPGYNRGYDRWKIATAQYMAEYLADNTSTENHDMMDKLLKKMGYPGDSIDATNAEYFLQYEPIIIHGRVGSSITNFIIAATPTEYKKYEPGLSGGYSPWFNNNTTGVYIYRAGDGEAPTNFTTGTGSGVNNLLSMSGGKIIGEGVAHIWLPDLIDSGLNCPEAVAYINEKYTVGTSAYREQITKVINGTFSYVDGSGVEYKIDRAYPEVDNLYEENYSKLPGGKAACEPNTKISLDCEAAVNYVNSNQVKYPSGSAAYHEAIAQIRNGTFEYEVINSQGTLTITRVDRAYPEFQMLVKETYMKKGGKAACEPVVCDFTGSDVSIDDCVTGKTFFGDIDDDGAWLICEIAFSDGNREYSSDNTGHEAVESTNGGIVGNAEYCELFCYEEVETQFPTNVLNVKAGQTFTWGTSDGTFGNVSFRKKCSNQSYIKGKQGYRFEEWEEDYRNNETAMIRYYMQKASHEKQLDIIRTSSSGKYTSCWKCSTCHSKDGGSYSCNCRYTCRYRYKGTATSSGQSHTYSHGAYVGTVTGSVGSQSYSTGYSYTTSSAAKAAAKAGLESKLRSLANSKYSSYSSKKTSEGKLLEKIRQCYNNLKYVFKTTVQFTFSEPVNKAYGPNSRNFEFDDDLLVNGSYNENNVNTSQCKWFNAYSYTCHGTKGSASCTPKLERVRDCTVVTWDVKGRYTYTYPVEEFQWYSLKTDSTLVNEKLKGSEDEAFFYYIGFGLPTALSLTNGQYELKVTVANLGDNAKTNGAQNYNTQYGHFYPIAEEVTINSGKGYGFEYSCEYEVDNEIFGYDCQYDSNGNLLPNSPEYCDKDEDEDSNGSLVGIDVAYRLITLLSDEDNSDKSFPGMDGTGRQPGSNWGFSELQFHEILDADIYEDDQAMYEIMLDVNAINRIREDNENYFNAGRDPYTSYVDENNNQKVYCATDSTGNVKYCASDFISELYNRTGLNYPLLGTCLPTANTQERAEYILENGCDTAYTYPELNWLR